MKKCALLLAAALSLTLTACGGNTASGSSASAAPTPAPSTAPSASTAPAVDETIPEPTLEQGPVVLKQFQEAKGPTATIKTSMGDIEVQFFPEEAPKAVESFLTHAKEGYYDGLLFHRVIDGFMLQGGDPMGNGTGGESIWKAPFEDEFSDNLHNFRGALSMANSGLNTNGSQFFIVQSSDKSVDKLADTLYGNLLVWQAQSRIAGKLPQFTSQEQLNAYVQKEQDALTAQLAKGTPTAYADKLAPVIAKYKEVGGTPYLDNKHTVFGQVTKGMEVVDAIAKVEKGANDKPVKDVTILSIAVKE